MRGCCESHVNRLSCGGLFCRVILSCSSSCVVVVVVVVVVASLLVSCIATICYSNCFKARSYPPSARSLYPHHVLCRYSLWLPLPRSPSFSVPAILLPLSPFPCSVAAAVALRVPLVWGWKNSRSCSIYPPPTAPLKKNGLRIHCCLSFVVA